MYKLHCGMHKAAVEPSDFYTVDTKRILPTLLHSRGQNLKFFFGNELFDQLTKYSKNK